MTQTYENSKYIAKETGLLNDYLNAKYHTGICFCTDSLMKFIYYHSRIQMVKGYKFSYLLLEPYKAVPPCYVEFKEGNLVLHYVGDTNILFGDITIVKHEKFMLSGEYIKYTDEY